MPGGGIPYCSFCNRKWGCNNHSEPCIGFRQLQEKRGLIFTEYGEWQPKPKKLEKLDYQYAVCGQDFGVCPTSHGQYEIQRFIKLDDARIKRDACLEKAKKTGVPVTDDIFILSIRYEDYCSWCQNHTACQGHVNWHAKGIN